MFHDDEREYFIWLSHAAMAFYNQSAFLLYFYIYLDFLILFLCFIAGYFLLKVFVFCRLNIHFMHTKSRKNK